MAASRKTSKQNTRKPALKKNTPIYQIYNGFMLGLFVAGKFFYELKKDKLKEKKMIARISEFLLEFHSDHQKELNFQPYAHLSLEEAVYSLLQEQDNEIASYYQLGQLCFRCTLNGRENKFDSDDWQEACLRLSELGYSPLLFKNSIVALWDGSKNDAVWDELITCCLKILREMIAVQQPEGDTCFVAMPFTDEYEKRYLNFYRLCARNINTRTIRAWGGLGMEEYQELMLALIHKSETFLADVTEPNLNVAFEVGYALGQNKDVYLVANQKKWKSPANIVYDWVFPYAVNKQDQWQEVAGKAGLYFTVLKESKKPGLIPSWNFKPLDVLELLANAKNEKKKKITK